MSTHPPPPASYAIFCMLYVFSHRLFFFLEGMLDLQSGPLSTMASRRSWLRRPAGINREVPSSLCAVSPTSTTSHGAVYRPAWWHNPASTKRKAANPASVTARIILTESHNPSAFPGPNPWHPRSNPCDNEANPLAFTSRGTL